MKEEINTSAQVGKLHRGCSGSRQLPKPRWSPKCAVSGLQATSAHPQAGESPVTWGALPSSTGPPFPGLLSGGSLKPCSKAKTGHRLRFTEHGCP